MSIRQSLFRGVSASGLRCVLPSYLSNVSVHERHQRQPGPPFPSREHARCTDNVRAPSRRHICCTESTYTVREEGTVTVCADGQHLDSTSVTLLVPVSFPSSSSPTIGARDRKASYGSMLKSNAGVPLITSKAPISLPRDTSRPSIDATPCGREVGWQAGVFKGPRPRCQILPLIFFDG